MAKTAYQIKKALGLSNGLKAKGKPETTEELKANIKAGKYNSSFGLVKSDLEKTIRFDTFESDLSSMGKALGDTLGGWQSPEALQTNRSSIESMQSRLSAYKEYQRLFGKDAESIKNVESMQNDIRNTLDGWDALSEKYGQYKDADAYTKETTKLGELGKMTSSDVEKARNEATSEIARLGLDEKLKTAKGYEDNLKKLSNSAMNIKNPSAVKPFQEALKKATEERDNYLKSIGYDSVEAIENALSKKNIAYTTVGGENITWQSLYDTKKYNEDSDALYEEISSREDFEKYKTEGAKIKNPTFDEAELGISIAGWNPFAKDVQNKVEYAIENETLMDMNGRSDDTKYASVTSQERDIYNYHLGRERAGLAEKGTADAYLESIGGVLKDRYEDKSISKLTQYADEHPVLSSVASVWQSLASGVEFVGDGINYLATGELDDNYYARASSAIRGTVSQKVDWEIGNWDAFDFVYNTGMSMADSVVSMATLGSAGGVALGLSAAAQGTNDALARGLDNKSAFWNGLSAGVFEAAFESLSIGKFKALKDAPIDSVKTIIKNVGKSMLVNASEETLTEIANILYDNIANADLSQAKTNMRAYVRAGMSEKEAASKVASEQALQVVEAGASGALMGFGFGGIAGASAYNTSKNTGKTIKANERVGELFDIASNPEVASAYETYTRYANKGINADNITDAQLGRLYSEAKADAQTTLDSKKSTPEQIKSAEKIKADLDVYAQYNPSARVSKKIAKDVNDEESIKALIESGLESGENTESFKLATEYQAKLDSGKKLSTNEILRLVEANEKAFKDEDSKSVTERLTELGESENVENLTNIITRKMSGEVITSEEFNVLKDSKYGNQVLLENTNEEVVDVSKTMDKESSELFLRLYDGKTDADAYANSFNLVSEYAKHPAFTADFILDNRGVLSVEQAKEIVKSVGIAQHKADVAEFEALIEKSRSRMHLKGSVDDSVIDYDNTSAEGKVNWNDLTSRQKKAVTYLSGLFKGLGTNLVFVGKNKKFNGWYHIEGDTVFVDVYAGINYLAGKGEDTIIPTASHELSHEMEFKSPELYKKVADIVLDTVASSKKLTRADIIADELARLNERHPENEHTEKEAISEIVARACEDMLSKSKEGKKIFNSLSEAEQKTLVERIKDVINKIIDWIDDFLSSYNSNSEEAKALRNNKEAFEEVLKYWDMMLADIAKQNQALEKSGAFRDNASAEGGTLYALREEAISEVEQAISDKNYDKEIKLTDSSPAILASQKGVKNLPMMMVASHVRENILTEKEAKNLGLAVNSNKHYHGLGKDLFLKVIDGLDNVTEAYRGTKNAEKSERRENYFLLISQYKDSNGNTINVPVYVNEHGIYNRIFVDTNKIATVFGRNELKAYIKKQVAEGNLVRIKNRSTQASESTPLIDGDYSKNASKDSIPNSDKNVKEKFSDRDTEYLELAKDPVKNEARLREMVYEAAKEAGYTVKAYHGTGRADRVGTVFRPDRATSGPMAYFTDNKEIATNYARDKADTSLAYDEEYDSYYTQFRVNRGGKSISIPELWKHLSISEKTKIKELAGQIKFDDDYENIIVDKSAKHGNGAYDAYTLNMHRGNVLEALVDTWLETGELYRREADFLEVLKLVGIEDVEYRNPDARHEKVYDTWLKIQKPFDTEFADKTFYDSLSEWIETHDMSVYEKETSNADMWDKNNQTPETWLEKLNNDIENGTTHAWTVIPDFVTDYLKEQHFDGIKDKGGKGGGDGHTVWIPFSSEQIKSAEPITYDDKGKVIPLSQRFNAENDDIRYSEKVTEIKKYSYDELIGRDDLEGFVIDKTKQVKLSKDGKIDAPWVVNEVKKKCKVLKTNSNTNAYYTEVPDIERKVEISYKGITHGFMKSLLKKTKVSSNRDILNARVSLEIPHILRNSIEVNRSSREGNLDIPYAHIMIGTVGLEDANGNVEYYAVRSVIEERVNQNPILAEAEVLGKLHGINAKKIGTPHARVTNNGVALTSSDAYTYNVAQFLEDVKTEFDDTFSEDVYQKLAMKRKVNDFSKDLLYSEKDDTSVYDLMGETERLKKENERFKADVERLRERLKIERQITHGNYFNENQLGAVAGHLRNIAKSSYDKVTLMRELKDVYSFIAQSPNLTWNEVFEKCCKVAVSMLEESKPLTMTDEYTKRILQDIRSTSISLSETQKQEAKYLFGKHWNRSFFGNITITDKGVPLEAKWQDWAEQYPHLFETDITEGDMVGELYDTIGTLKDASEILVEYDEEEQIRWLAREIYNQYWNVSNIKTTADKYDQKIKLLNFEHRKAMAEFRSGYEDRVEKQKLVDDMYYRRKMSEQKGKFNAELSAQRKAQQERYQQLYRDLRERKDEQIAIAKQHGREMVDKYKDNAERKTRIQSITANALSLNEMLIKNSKDRHVPEILKEPVTAMLQALDFSSKRLLEKGVPTQKDISLSRSLNKVKDMMVKATNAHNDLVELYGHGLDEDIGKMVDSVDNIRNEVGDNEFVLNQMTLEDLQTLDKMVKTIRHAVNKLNKFHTVNHAKGIANLSKESVEYLDSLGKGKIYDGKRGAAKKLLDWGNSLPYYVFKRFGSGGTKVYEALQDGWDKFAFNVKKIIDYTKEVYTSKEVKEWSEEVKTFKVLVPASELDMANPDYTPQYQEVQLTVPQIMSLYCLNKREQARGHLFKGGIRVADFKTKKGEVVSQSDGIIFTEKDVSAILNSLTDKQKAVADKLQEFMNTVCAEWGNDVSMARFGYKAFGEENYFPIQSDKNNLAVNDETEQLNSLFKLLNMAFTKATDSNANNRIVISDIFDVFAQHTSDMAKYNALALPVLDAFKWYNHTEKQDVAEGTFKTKGVKQSMETAFGGELITDGGKVKKVVYAQEYFTTFLKDINGQQEVSRDTLGKGFFKNAKIASVGANLRVMLLQPTSYVRASAVIDNQYLLKALGHKPKTKKAEEHCGIALWKSMGYYDTNVQRGVEEQIKHDGTWKDKAVEWSMKGAEVADKVTWGYLWNACELEIRDKRKDLKVGSKEFYDAISKRLREVIYTTQVVDSTMTRSQMMRSGDWRDKMLTTFASEPTLAYNMLQDAYMEYSLDARRMGKAEAIKKNGKHIARVMYAYTMTNAVAALVESAFDAFRDDDDEEMDMIEFMKLYFKNFAFDMSIGNKIPYVKDLYSLLQGYSSSRMDTQWAQYLQYALNAKTPAKKLKYMIQFTSQLSGLPFYNVYRDTMAALNKLDLFTEEDLNEMFEDFLD